MWKAISFYTPKYKYIVEGLTSSLKRFDIPYDIEAVEDKGGWMANTYYKPYYIRRKLDEHKEDLVWIDADAVVKKYPKYFDIIEEDIGVYIRRRSRFYGELVANLIFLKNNKAVKKLIDDWIMLEGEDTDKRALEQTYLERALLENDTAKHAVRTFYFPNSYSVIKDITDWEEPVIWNSQASREFR